jgi:hypothetical protein
LRIDGLAAGQINISNYGGDVLNKLKSGDTIRAQILENNGDELTLKLSDGSTVSANALTAINAKEGDFVNFEFKGMDEGKLVLQLAGKNIQQPVNEVLENIKNTLTALKLPLTDENIEMALALDKQNLPVTAETIARLTDLVGSNRGLKADSAAFLMAAKMSDDMNNIEKLQSLLAGRLKISDGISGLIKLMEGLTGGKETPSDINNVLTRLSNILRKNTENLPVKASVIDSLMEKLGAEAKSSISANGTGNINTNGQNIMQNSSSFASANSKNAGQNVGSNAVGTPGPAVEMPETREIGTAGANESGAKAGDLTKTSGNSLEERNLPEAALKVGLGKSSTINEQVSITNRADNSMSSIENMRPFGKADLPVLIQMRHQLDNLLVGKDAGSEQILAAKFISREIDKILAKVGANQMELDSFRQDASKLRTLENAVNTLKNLFVKIDQNNDEINPVRLYNEINNSLLSVKNAVQLMPVSYREAAGNIANNLESNLNFINQLNNYSSYVQLPLSIFNKETTGELYMLKKGSKNRKLDPSNITVLISLDSNHIGRIDTLLSIDHKDVCTNFRLEDSKVFRVLKDNHKMLYNALLEKGYRLVDFTYRLLEEPISVVNFENEARKEFIKAPNNIDILI